MLGVSGHLASASLGGQDTSSLGELLVLSIIQGVIDHLLSVKYIS